jgi:hypothetical protein
MFGEERAGTVDAVDEAGGEIAALEVLRHRGEGNHRRRGRSVVSCVFAPETINSLRIS